MEEQLKELMGESYHEGITNEEIQTFFKNSILGGGEYVNKQMAEAEKKKLQDELNKAKASLGEKLTDDEKKAEADKEREARITELEQALAKNTLATNSYKALGITAEARLNADIKDDDKEFGEFIDNIVSDDEEKTKKISSYVNKIVKAAYEKGKADMTKNKMANMGNFKKNENNDGEGDGESRAARLAKLATNSLKNETYFKL